MPLQVRHMLLQDHHSLLQAHHILLQARHMLPQARHMPLQAHLTVPHQHQAHNTELHSKLLNKKIIL